MLTELPKGHSGEYTGRYALKNTKGRGLTFLDAGSRRALISYEEGEDV